MDNDLHATSLSLSRKSILDSFSRAECAATGAATKMENYGKNGGNRHVGTFSRRDPLTNTITKDLTL